PFAQALGCLGQARRPESGVEQPLAGGDVGEAFVADGDHAELPARRGVRAETCESASGVGGQPAFAGSLVVRFRSSQSTRGILGCELRNQRTTSNISIP